jgi:haloalkane dehalogenase
MVPPPPDGRPAWVDSELFPFESRFLEVEGCRVHYVDEGEGLAVLMLHGNPTWSFLYRGIIRRLRERMRCIALDYPGFGLSSAPAGYGFLPAEHSRVVERFMLDLDLRELTLMVQDWGGPIGFGAATRQPDRMAAFVVGNTWAWPVGGGDLTVQIFSRLMGGPIGGYLIKQRNFFVERIVPGGIKRRTPSQAVMDHYRGPFPTPESRRPVHVFPREILKSGDFLAEVERGLGGVADRPALLVWADRDPAFRAAARQRWERTFPNHETVMLHGAGHYLQEDAPDEVADAVLRWHPLLRESRQ